jgi:hypothetical protein
VFILFDHGANLEDVCKRNTGPGLPFQSWNHCQVSLNLGSSEPNELRRQQLAGQAVAGFEAMWQSDATVEVQRGIAHGGQARHTSFS